MQLSLLSYRFSLPPTCKTHKERFKVGRDTRWTAIRVIDYRSEQLSAGEFHAGKDYFMVFENPPLFIESFLLFGNWEQFLGSG